jgi:hypothetical protein
MVVSLNILIEDVFVLCGAVFAASSRLGRDRSVD